MVEWNHRLNGHEFEQALGVGDEQGGLGCCSPWGHKESDTTKKLNNNKLNEFTQMEYIPGYQHRNQETILPTSRKPAF